MFCVDPNNKISKGQLDQARKNNKDINSKTEIISALEISFESFLFYWEILPGETNGLCTLPADNFLGQSALGENDLLFSNSY